MPVDLADYKTIEANKRFFGSKFWAPDRATIDMCHDKLALNRRLLGGRFAELVPPLRPGNDGTFPYIVKKRGDIWGVNSFVVRNGDDERTLAPQLQSPEYFCQAYVSGTEEFALHVLMAGDEVAYAQTVKYEIGRDFYVLGKNLHEQRRALLPENEFLATFSALLAELNYSGTCCIDYKMDNGRPKLMEINPRVGASLTADINRYLEAYLTSLAIA